MKILYKTIHKNAITENNKYEFTLRLENFSVHVEEDEKDCSVQLGFKTKSCCLRFFSKKIIAIISVISLYSYQIWK